MQILLGGNEDKESPWTEEALSGVKSNETRWGRKRQARYT